MGGGVNTTVKGPPVRGSKRSSNEPPGDHTLPHRVQPENLYAHREDSRRCLYPRRANRQEDINYASHETYEIAQTSHRGCPQKRLSLIGKQTKGGEEVR